MKLMLENLSEAIEISEGTATVLQIENQNYFRQVIEDIKKQIEGEEGKVFLYDKTEQVTFEKKGEILTDFSPFVLNTKKLSVKIQKALEKKATDEKNYMKSQEILSLIEKYIYEINEESFNLYLSKLEISSIIKAVAPILVEDFSSPLEGLLDYMDYITGFDGDKLFITVNLRTFFTDEDIKALVDTVTYKGFRLLMLENSPQESIDGLLVNIIDKDLCHI